MAVEASAMSVCGSCAGEVARDTDGHLVCALPDQVPGETPEASPVARPLCPLPSILAELRGQDPRRVDYRQELSVLATDSWLAQHARSGSETVPLAFTPPKKRSSSQAEEGDN